MLGPVRMFTVVVAATILPALTGAAAASGTPTVPSVTTPATSPTPTAPEARVAQLIVFSKASSRFVTGRNMRPKTHRRLTVSLQYHKASSGI